MKWSNEINGYVLAPEEPPKPTNLILLQGFLPLFKIGATVRLKSGSPVMTVTAVKDGHVEVQWFDGLNVAKQKIYPVSALYAAPKRRKINVEAS